MSTALFHRKAGGMARKNDALRDAFSLDGVRCFLLKHKGQSESFLSITEVLSGWRIKFDDNRAEGGLFRFATTNIAGFRGVWGTASHIGYGVPTSDKKIECYNFPDGEKDRIDPDGSSVYFGGRIVREPQLRFTIPDYIFDADGTYLTDADGFRIYDGG